MRCRLFLCTLLGLLLLGCEQNTRPKAARAVPGRTGNSAPQASIQSPPHGSYRSGGSEESIDKSGGEVRLDAITLTAPSGWGRKRAESSFIEAEFMLPRAEGDDADGRLTISSAGGTVEANIDRWKGQFGGSPKNAKQEQIDAGGMSITLVDFSGDFNDQRGPFAPPVNRPGYRMIAAIVPGNGQLHFVKAVGPQKTIEAHADEFKTFVRSVKRQS
ncbi:MAG TPA: hypothetical protein VL371_01345 [Gemmataceae bacterium]|jgi:hypothetical protein|nr:hypothetical protein [Gemmataceae bacterium]